jgi:hypothetical protein
MDAREYASVSLPPCRHKGARLEPGEAHCRVSSGSLKLDPYVLPIRNVSLKSLGSTLPRLKKEPRAVYAPGACSGSCLNL